MIIAITIISILIVVFIIWKLRKPLKRELLNLPSVEFTGDNLMIRFTEFDRWIKVLFVMKDSIPYYIGTTVSSDLIKDQISVEFSKEQFYILQAEVHDLHRRMTLTAKINPKTHIAKILTYNVVKTN